MIRLYDFGIDVQTYADLGKQNAFPSIHRCPHCQVKRTLYRHGYYERNALMGQEAYRIWIARYRCTICQKTVTVLPTFLFPYFQYTIWTILPCINERLSFLLDKGTRSSRFFPTRQGVYFYMRRLLSNLPWLRWFFQTKGKRILGLSDEPLVQAQEWIQKMEEVCLEKLIQAMWNEQSTHFLANRFGA
ncbi:MAG: transposase [Bacillaceae bacterium]|uniref:Transposase n=2 Tax=Aeribacillus TaxID=1055323 RepID=A0A165WVG5_9BACI|nr:transposase [Aeribacillus pallidus]KZN95375.1 transposase [Aeribacillus pallidus]REJ12333.1 MAG: transposase [Bacillaceae bacterium]TVZ75337.1 hypothetical protein FB379_1643 [Aeribacillus composti]